MPSVSSTGRQGFREKQSMPTYEQAGNEEENLARAPPDPFYRKTVKDSQLLPMPGTSN